MNKTFGNYEVYDNGRVYSNLSNKFLKLRKNNKGYYMICLRENNKNKWYLVSRLVAINFIDNPNNYKEVNHIDGNPLNNNVSNLEWCDRSYNVQDSYNRGYKGAWFNKKGINHCRSLPIKSIKDGIEIIYNSLTEAEQKTGTSHGNISQVISGKRNQAGGYVWKLL